MKKIYNAPEITVVNLNTTNCLLTNSITINTDGESVDAGQAAARSARFSSWSDEDDE
jgi:hypothetical protein